MGSKMMKHAPLIMYAVNGKDVGYHSDTVPNEVFTVNVIFVLLMLMFMLYVSVQMLKLVK
jgi:hypothetical protein